MSVIAEVEQLAFSLPENERAKLAERLWESLSEDFIDEEEMELAMRRSREMDEHPEMSISLDEFDRFFEERRK